jgi:hypothetical protein
MAWTPAVPISPGALVEWPRDGWAYGSNTAVQNALTTADSATGSGAINCSGNWNWWGYTQTTCSGPSGSVSCPNWGFSACDVTRGTYTTLTASNGANVNLNSGTHTFTGGCSLSNGSNLSGSAVTILVGSGTTKSPSSFTSDSTSTVAITAATTSGATNGQIAGVVYASHSTGSCSMNGSSSSPLIKLLPGDRENRQFQRDVELRHLGLRVLRHVELPQRPIHHQGVPGALRLRRFPSLWPGPGCTPGPGLASW